MAINSKGNIIVSEFNRQCVSVINPAKLERVIRRRSFGLRCPIGVAVDDDDNILVAVDENNCILKFISDGIFISPQVLLKRPVGIAIHPQSKKLYVTSQHSCITIVNPDLTWSNIFGSPGDGDGHLRQFGRKVKGYVGPELSLLLVYALTGKMWCIYD